jgi:dsDNA-specific endonuclease/ATPase MutS2
VNLPRKGARTWFLSLFFVRKRRKDKGFDSSDREPDAPFSEPVAIPLEDSIDLHSFSPKDIPSVVEEYLEQCIEAGLSEVRIIHGRGVGIQRNIVRSLLGKYPGVESFQDAPAEAGGWGATRVVLRKKA